MEISIGNVGFGLEDKTDLSFDEKNIIRLIEELISPQFIERVGGLRFNKFFEDYWNDN